MYADTYDTHDFYVDRYETYVDIYSVLHVESHFFTLNSRSLTSFSRALLPNIIRKRPSSLKMEIGVD